MTLKHSKAVEYMRPNQNQRRRGGGRSHGNGHNRRPSNIPLRHQTFDSNGPDVRIRGSAFQVHEKYLALARDATASGDRIAAENYYQHAEHYYRIIALINEAEQARHQQYRSENRLDSGASETAEVVMDGPSVELRPEQGSEDGIVPPLEDLPEEQRVGASNA